MKDAKIPPYEKIDKNSRMYKHLMNIMSNEKLEQTAIEQKVEDKKMLKDIGGSINAQKVATDNPK